MRNLYENIQLQKQADTQAYRDILDLQKKIKYAKELNEISSENVSSSQNQAGIISQFTNWANQGELNDKLSYREESVKKNCSFNPYLVRPKVKKIPGFNSDLPDNTLDCSCKVKDILYKNSIRTHNETPLTNGNSDLNKFIRLNYYHPLSEDQFRPSTYNMYDNKFIALRKAIDFFPYNQLDNNREYSLRKRRLLLKNQFESSFENHLRSNNSKMNPKIGPINQIKSNKSMSEEKNQSSFKKKRNQK